MVANARLIVTFFEPDRETTNGAPRALALGWEVAGLAVPAGRALGRHGPAAAAQRIANSARSGSRCRRIPKLHLRGVGRMRVSGETPY